MTDPKCTVCRLVLQVSPEVVAINGDDVVVQSFKYVHPEPVCSAWQSPSTRLACVPPLQKFMP